MGQTLHPTSLIISVFTILNVTHINFMRKLNSILIRLFKKNIGKFLTIQLFTKFKKGLEQVL